MTQDLAGIVYLKWVWVKVGVPWNGRSKIKTYFMLAYYYDPFPYNIYIYTRNVYIYIYILCIHTYIQAAPQALKLDVIEAWNMWNSKIQNRLMDPTALKHPTRSHFLGTRTTFKVIQSYSVIHWHVSPCYCTCWWLLVDRHLNFAVP